MAKNTSTVDDSSKIIAEEIAKKLKISPKSADTAVLKELQKISALTESSNKFLASFNVSTLTEKPNQIIATSSKGELNSPSVTPKSELEQIDKPKKVEIVNFKELASIIPDALKTIMKDLKGELSHLSKELKNIDGKGGGESGNWGTLGTIYEIGKELFKRGGKSAAKEVGKKAVTKVGTEAAKEVGEKALIQAAEKTTTHTVEQAAASAGKEAVKAAAEKATTKVATEAAEKGLEKGLVSGLKSKIAASIAKRIPKALGGALAKSVPFLGAAIGGAFAIPRLLRGDYSGAALEVGSGVGSAATAIPLTALLIAKDVYQDVYGMSPEKDPQSAERMKLITKEVTQAASDFLGKEKKPETKVPDITPEPVKEAVSNKNSKSSRLKQSVDYKNAIAKEAGLTKGEQIQYIGGIPVDSKENPLLDTKTLNELQKKYNQQITENPEQQIKAAQQMRAAMTNVGGSEGGAGRLNIDQSGSKPPAINPEPVKEAVAAKSPAINPEPVKETANTKTGSQTVIENLNKQQSIISDWIKKGYRGTQDVPKEELEAYVQEFAPKSMPHAYAVQAIKRSVNLQLVAKGAKADTGSNNNTIERNLETGEVKTTPAITPEPVKEAVKPPAITPEPVKEAVKPPAITPEPVKEAVAAKTPNISRGVEMEVVFQKWREKGYRSLNDIPREEYKEFEEKYRIKSLPKAYSNSSIRREVELGINPTATRTMSPEFAAAVKAASAKTEISKETPEQNKITPNATTAPVSVAPTEPKPPVITPNTEKPAQLNAPEQKKVSFDKAETILERIANNTGSSDQNIRNLINGFNGLAKALEQTTGQKMPTIVPNNQQKPPSISDIANVGNSIISNFRTSTVEGARFQPA